MTATADKDKAEKEFTKILPKNFLDKGKAATLKVKEIVRDRRLQVRSDTAGQPDSHYAEVDEHRAEQIGVTLAKNKSAVQRVKVMKVKDMPGRKDEEVYVCFDGMHTHRGAEIEKIPDLDALVWEGTWDEALAAAATHANREHEANGRPLSTKDKVRSVELMGNAYKASKIPKGEWPSNRQAAELCGCSRQLVNEIDPFERRGGDKRQLTAAKKRGERAAGKAPAVKAPKHFQIIQKTTGAPVAGYDADSEDEALKRHKEVHPDYDMKSVVAKLDTSPTRKPGSERPAGFDWAGLDGNLGYLIRGLDGAADLFGFKGTPEYKQANEALNIFAGRFREFRQKYAKAKPAATGNGKPAAAATPAAAAAK